MDSRRSPWPAVVRLAVVVSAIALAVTLALSAFGDVSQTALVGAVIVAGFVVSWVHSGRSLDPDRRDPSARHPRGRAHPTTSGRPGDGTDAGSSDRAGGHRGHASHRVVVVPLHPGAARRT